MSKDICCAVCGAYMRGKWSWAKWEEGRVRERRICMDCGRKGWRFGRDGTVYHRRDEGRIVSPWNKEK